MVALEERGIRVLRVQLLKLISAKVNLKLISIQILHSQLYEPLRNNMVSVRGFPQLMYEKGANTMSRFHCRWVVLIAVTAFAIAGCHPRAYASAPTAQAQENLTEEQMRDFLLHAKVVASKQGSKGVTRPFILTLKQGTMVHDGSFQSIDEYTAFKKLDNGIAEPNFRDSYKFNIAAFELAKMLGLGDMMPVTVERKWERKIGSLSWWLPSVMSEEKRLSKNIEPPDRNAYNKQYTKWVIFSQLVYDSDHNATNLLISENWHLWMIDFSRAFRRYLKLEDPKKLLMCDRQLLRKLRQLDAAELEQKTKNLLNKEEIKGVMARRDLIVAFFDDLITKKGENAVLYD
jgi:hypothetical protein